MIIKEFYVTDAREALGSVYKVDPLTESIFFRRRKGNIYSIAFSRNGVLYFVNANENSIYKVRVRPWFNWAVKVYTYETYVRDVALDRRGNLYFSEASGARANGKIYRLDGNVFSRRVSIFQEIRLPEVGGFWSGNFAFDEQGSLCISSGNRIPSSIYRLVDGAWDEIFRDENEPIKGLAFLLCDLLCYANWRSEIYVLDIQSGSRELIYSNPIHQWVSDIAFFDPRIEEATLYEGTKDYTCNSVGWREDGTVDDGWEAIFPDIDADNDNIRTLLSDIGLPTTPTTDDNEVWNRARRVWSWLQAHGLGSGDPNYDAACEYRSSVVGGHWPSIAELAYMFTTYGGFPWVVTFDEETETWEVCCSCMCKAQILATLLYKAGIPSNRLAIAQTKFRLESSQHMYVVLRLGCHWYYVDPTADISELNDTPENVGIPLLPADYVHPNHLFLTPGSRIGKPMLIR